MVVDARTTANGSQTNNGEINNEYKEKGYHNVRFDVTNLPSDVLK